MTEFDLINNNGTEEMTEPKAVDISAEEAFDKSCEAADVYGNTEPDGIHRELHAYDDEPELKEESGGGLGLVLVGGALACLGAWQGAKWIWKGGKWVINKVKTHSEEKKAFKEFQRANKPIVEGEPEKQEETKTETEGETID